MGVLPCVLLLPARHMAGRKTHFSTYTSALEFAAEDQILHIAICLLHKVQQLFFIQIICFP